MEKIKEQWTFALDVRKTSRHTINIIFGCAFIGAVLTAVSFIVGASCHAIQTAFKYGYGLW